MKLTSAQEKTEDLKWWLRPCNPALQALKQSWYEIALILTENWLSAWVWRDRMGSNRFWGLSTRTDAKIRRQHVLFATCAKISRVNPVQTPCNPVQRSANAVQTTCNAVQTPCKRRATPCDAVQHLPFTELIVLPGFPISFHLFSLFLPRF